MLQQGNSMRTCMALNTRNGFNDFLHAFEHTHYGESKNIRSGTVTDQERCNIPSTYMRSGTQRSFPVSKTPIPCSACQFGPLAHQFFYLVKIAMRSANYTAHHIVIHARIPVKKRFSINDSRWLNSSILCR